MNRTAARRLAILMLVLGAGALCAAAAAAFVPPAKHVAIAVAKANRVGKRTQALRCEVQLIQPEDGSVLATGELITAPDGRSRLELVGEEGRDRYLRVGGRLDATRDGLANAGAPRLPPLHLLQLGSSGDLQRALSVLGTSGNAIGLGHDDRVDAYVLGTRGSSALWIDMDELSAARIDLPGGTIVRLGKHRSYGSILWPQSLRIESEGTELRLDFDSVVPTQVDDTTFARDWLVR